MEKMIFREGKRKGKEWLGLASKAKPVFY